MLLSISLILIIGMSMGWICRKIKLPSLLGMLLTGIVLGPYVLNLIDADILNISAQLRKIALIIILTRAGLGLDISGLKKIGRPAIMMCFVPASFELLGMLLLAPRLLGMSLLEAAIMGAVLAKFFELAHIRDTAKVLIILSISFILVTSEDTLTTSITFSALIAIMFIGVGLQKYRVPVAKRLSAKYAKLWVGAEVFLFVLVGAAVNVSYLKNVGVSALVVIAGALVFRMLGVFVCLLGTKLNKKERLFTMMAYTPKATVQAAIGGIPLAMGFSCGETVLTVAVLAIVLTAPLGAFAIDASYKKFLAKD